MIGRIQIINVKYKQDVGIIKGWGIFVYCGRKFGGYEGGILGNYVGKGFDREEAINRFRDNLWIEYKKKGEVYDELIRLRNVLLSGVNVGLGCWCAPKDCHCDVIKSCLEWMISNS